MAVTLSTSACATIVGDERQNVSINSSPAEAEVTIKDQSETVIERADTPTTVTLDKSAGYFDGEEYTLQFQKEGFEAQTMTISSNPNGWYLAGNLLFGGLIGWFIIDPATGAMWTRKPQNVDAELPAARTSSSGTSVRVVMVEDVPKDLRDNMERIEIQ